MGDVMAKRLPQRMTAAAYSKSVARLMSEEDIHIRVVRYIEAAILPGIAWAHMPSGELRSTEIGRKLKRMGTKPGWPDLQFIKEGRFYGLELKRIGGVTSKNQQAAHGDLIIAGATIAVVEGFDGAVDQLRKWGLVR